MHFTHLGFAIGGLGLALAACSSGDTSVTSSTTTTTTGTIAAGVPDVFKHFTSAVTITLENGQVVIKATDVPDHKSTYFATTDSRYEAYNGTNPNYSRAPGNMIVAQTYTFRIPLSPSKAATSAATPLGPIGIAVNGVALFNQYNGQNRPLTEEINSFDQYNGHPSPSNEYHYHVEPLYLTKLYGSNALIGFLLDGFPVYGPSENGKRITNADLDQLHGHFSVTADYPAGIYHYHITDADPYINGAGFYGTAGTLGR